jgi:hypothetical protein
LQATLVSLVKAFAKGGLMFPMTEAQWGTLMMRIDTIARSFDLAYHDMVLAAFRGPSQQLRFQLPVPSFDMEAIEIDIGAPMDVSAFSDTEPIVPTAHEKGKAKVIEPGKEKRERKESNKIWEMRTFDMNLHDELQPQVSDNLAFHKFLLNPCCSVNAA